MIASAPNLAGTTLFTPENTTNTSGGRKHEILFLKVRSENHRRADYNGLQAVSESESERKRESILKIVSHAEQIKNTPTRLS
jgi:hypothetical protein